MELIVWIVSSVILIGFIVGWIFYYLTFPYWQRRGFWEKFTWVGFISMSKKMKTMKEPGRTYARIAFYFLNLTPIAFILFLLLFNLLKLF